MGSSEKRISIEPWTIKKNKSMKGRGTEETNGRHSLREEIKRRREEKRAMKGKRKKRKEDRDGEK